MRRRSGLASRLLAAQLLVIAVGALTLGAVDSLVGPPLFRSHVREALGDLPAGVAGHLQEALLTAGGIAIGVGVAASLLAAGAVSLLFTRRLSRPLSGLDAAAAHLAAGDYSVRVPATGRGPELDTLTVAFNAMAEALEGTEATRRRLLADRLRNSITNRARRSIGASLRSASAKARRSLKSSCSFSFIPHTFHSLASSP